MNISISGFSKSECGRYHILAVDDNKINLEILCDFLIQEGFRVTDVNNGPAALKAAENDGPDIILLDVMMPDMDGYEVCRKIKMIPGLEHIPVIFITALEDTLEKVKGFETGGIDYITKPFEPDEVIIRIKSHLALHAMQRELEIKNSMLQEEIVLRKKTEAELEAAHSELEKKVEERTWELQEANRILVQEIEERKKARAELIKAKEKAEKSDRLKTEFLAQISHEIRTPINTIINFSRLLKENMRSELTEFEKECFEKMEHGGDRIIRTVDLIINMSELQTGSYEGMFTTVRLGDQVLNRVYQTFLDKARRKDLELILNLPSEDIYIIADKYSLEQIFSNLIDNAVKYTESGKIVIDLFLNSEEHACVSIADTGIGISREYVNNLFTPFSQEEQGYTRRYEGNGLGLALVYKYCEINGAEIIVDSSKGKGTTFTIIFKNNLINSDEY